MSIRKGIQTWTNWHPRRIILIGLLFAFIFLFCSSSPTSMQNFSVRDNENGISVCLEKQAMTLSDNPIKVTNNSGLHDETGGTYIFENLIIDSSGLQEHGIEIRNTDHPFTIQNCIVTGISDVSAIQLDNVSHCHLENVKVVSNSHIGIELLSVENVTLMLSNFSYNQYGIEIRDSSFDVRLANNTIEENSVMGLYLDWSSSDNNIGNNTFESDSVNAKDDEPGTSNNFTNNYWSDYTGLDGNGDKIGDTPWAIDGAAGNADPRPSMLPPDRPPVYWLTIPPDHWQEYGEQFLYQLDAAVYGGVPLWSLNDSDYVIDDTGFITQTQWVAVGSHNIEVTVTNSYGDILNAIFTLHINDNTDPVWAETPVDQLIEVGSEFIYDLNATDFSTPLLYWLVNTPNFTINSATGIITNNSTLTIEKEYTITVHVKDAQDNEIDTTFTITVQDSTPPAWSVQPEDQKLEFATDFYYNLDATDLNGISTWTVNDTRFHIDNEGLVTNATILSLGDYAIEVQVNDTRGNILVGFFSVEVEDTTSPMWIEWPSDQILEYGEKLDIQLKVRDAAGILYWTISDTTNFDITTLGRVFSIADLIQVAYTLTVRAYDPSGNYVSAGFSVTIQDTKAPVWSFPLVDRVFELGTQLRIPLVAIDPSGVTGWALEEGLLFSIDSNGIITNATSLSVDTYVIHVSVRDILGHTLQGSFSVEIVDTTPPTWIDYPEEVNVTAPEILDYALLAIDFSGLDRWEINDTEHFLIDSEGHLVSRGALPAGPYGIAVIVYDPYGNGQGVEIRVNAFSLDPSIFLLGAGVWGVAIFLAIVMILIFDPKRRRINLFGEVG